MKLHTLLDLRGNVPVFVDITDGKVHDVNTLDLIDFESGAIYMMDKACTDFARLYEIDQNEAFFVIRGKDNLKFRFVSSANIEKSAGLKCNQIIRLT